MKTSLNKQPDNSWSDRTAQIQSDLKFQTQSSQQLLAAYNEWCIMNTKVEKGCFKKFAENIRR